ncbi:hypothetical protein CO151_12290 [bacterium CG_4_9_14_3_um_filter_65_15]|nr:MAG: hypothetical protein CO151_12290 [bacterium CG_4_9_14_3_um_filter_65_15]
MILAGSLQSDAQVGDLTVGELTEVGDSPAAGNAVIPPEALDELDVLVDLAVLLPGGNAEMHESLAPFGWGRVYHFRAYVYMD